MSDHDESLLRGPNDDDEDRRSAWRRVLAAGLYDAGYLLPPSAIDDVVEATITEAVAVGLIDDEDER